MPQPALHLLLAHATLEHWTHASTAPFDASRDANRNAFLIGSLAPDLGLFPGGDTRLSRRLHRERTGELVRALVARADYEPGIAFAWGWLSHVLADVAIHPLVNTAAARFAGTRTATLLDHVRVEVGVDAWLAWQHPALRRMRLRPFLDRRTAAFLLAAMHAVYGSAPTPARLLGMQRGMLRFTHLALHFATRVAREVCWDEGVRTAAAPLGSVVTWRMVTMLSTRTSATHAYLNPVRPGDDLIHGVERALHACLADTETWVRAGLRRLPDYDLETGALVAHARSVA